MKKFVFNDYQSLNNSEKVISEITDLIKQGRVGAIPTDTVYGFTCLAKNQQSVEKIVDIKGRGNNKNFLVLANNFKMITDLADLTDIDEAVLRKYWPGKNTLILKSKQHIPFISDYGTVAIRWPENYFLNKLIDDIGEPLVSTSLNRSGEKLIEDSVTAENIFPMLDFLVSIGKISGKPSSIYDFTKFADIRKIR